MDLYISGSNRKENCYKIANDLKSENDKFISLAEKILTIVSVVVHVLKA